MIRIMPGRVLFVFLAAGLLAGCSADYYERQADHQIKEIIKDRENTTLGYEPQVESKVQPEDRKPSPQAYTPIPQTPIPPAQRALVEPAKCDVEFGSLGPKRFDWPEGGPRAGSQFSYQTLDQKIYSRLRLGPPGLEQQVMRLDFFQSVKYGVEHSRSYQDQMENLFLAALNVTLQRHLFEPRPFANASLLYSGGQKDAAYATALTATGRMGVRQKLPYGGEVVAQGLVTFVNALNGSATSGEDASIVLSASVPLLKGAGMVNLEPLIAGERQMVYQVRGFENFRRDYVISIASQYFRLLNLYQAVIDRRLNFATYMTLTERSRALYAAGRINFLELQRSLQEQLTAENDVIDAQENYISSLDDFKLLLGMPTDENIEIVPIELDVRLPEMDEEQAVATAMKFRLDLQTARDQLEDSRRKVDNARNGLLPALDFSADVELGNRDGSRAAALDERTNTYSARLNLDLPIDRVAERNIYRASLISVRQAQRNVETLQDQIASDVRESIRLLKQSQLSLQIQRQGIDLAQRRLENAYELLRSGKSNSTRDLVEAQNSLLRARDRFESARATQQIQVLRFLRNAGTLRIDPAAGAIGHAMDRAGAESNKRAGLR